MTCSPGYGFVTKPCCTALFTGNVLIYGVCFLPSPSHPIPRDITPSASWTPQCLFGPAALQLTHGCQGGWGVTECLSLCPFTLSVFRFSSYFCSSVVFYRASSSRAQPFFFVFAQFICIQMILCSLPLSSSLLVSCLWVMSLWESNRGWKVS